MADKQQLDGDNESDVAPAPKKPRSKALLVGGGVVLSCLIGVGAYSWGLSRATVAEAAEAGAEVEVAEAAAPLVPGGIVTLNPFVVNLADRDSSRFLRVTIELAVATAEEAIAIDADPVRLTRMRAAIIEVLTQQMADTLTTPDGKATLEIALSNAIEPVLAPTVAMDVLFTDFVIQF